MENSEHSKILCNTLLMCTPRGSNSQHLLKDCQFNTNLTAEGYVYTFSLP